MKFDSKNRHIFDEKPLKTVNQIRENHPQVFHNHLKSEHLSHIKKHFLMFYNLSCNLVFLQAMLI